MHRVNNVVRRGGGGEEKKKARWGLTSTATGIRASRIWYAPG